MEVKEKLKMHLEIDRLRDKLAEAEGREGKIREALEAIKLIIPSGMKWGHSCSRIIRDVEEALEAVDE